MLVISFVQWWYGRGYAEYLARFVDRLRDLADFFSIRLLIRHFFAPFRQIATEKRQNIPLNERLHDFADLMISRMVGATIRFFLLIVGTVILIVRALVGLVIMVAWPLMPVIIACLVVLYVRGVIL